MQEPPLLRAIYAELRDSAGTEISAGDLLRLAHTILRAFKAEYIEGPEEPRYRQRDGEFHSMPVDEAMKDGGWKVLHFEGPGSPPRHDVAPEADMFLNHQLTKFLGHEWQRLIPPG